jgi:small subunit ribosomal protein S16
MALKIRMSRAGARNRPFFKIVVADSRSPRDGSFIERLGSYNPMLEKGHKDRVVLNAERIQHWMKNGAKPSDRVARFLHEAGHGPKPVIRETPKKSAPRAKTQERMKAAAEASGKAAETPAADAPAQG